MRIHVDQRREGFFDIFPDDVVEVNLSRIYPGQNAGSWHAHERQDDVWFVASGQLKVGLIEPGKDPRFVVLGPGEVVRIPAGVWHSYWNYSVKRPAILVYGLTNKYNPAAPDELRMGYDEVLASSNLQAPIR